MLFHLLFNLVSIGSPNIFIYGIFMVLMIYSYTTLMNRDVNAIWLEAIKLIIGLVIIFKTGTWFGFGEVVAGADILMAGYFIFNLS